MAAGMDRAGQPLKRETAKLKTDYELEDYSPERIAEFLLPNALDAEDDAEAVAEVRRPMNVPFFLSKWSSYRLNRSSAARASVVRRACGAPCARVARSRRA
jgi:hypothetical protein